MKKIILTTLLLASCSMAAQAENKSPKFTDYSVKSVYTGKTAKLDLSDPSAKMFRTRLSDALKEKPDFAGEYVSTMWGCGADCRSYSFISKRTGKLLDAYFGGESNAEDVVATNPKSRLLVTEQENKDENYNVESITVRYYVLENGKLKLIKTQKTKP